MYPGNTYFVKIKKEASGRNGGKPKKMSRIFWRGIWNWKRRNITNRRRRKFSYRGM
jgi:hypothetical protein